MSVQGAALCSEHWRQQNPREALLEFDRSRKLMSVACRSGAQRRLFVKGAPEAVVVACSSAIDNSGACALHTCMRPRPAARWRAVMHVCVPGHSV